MSARHSRRIRLYERHRQWELELIPERDEDEDEFVRGLEGFRKGVANTVSAIFRATGLQLETLARARIRPKPDAWSVFGARDRLLTPKYHQLAFTSPVEAWTMTAGGDVCSQPALRISGLSSTTFTADSSLIFVFLPMSSFFTLPDSTFTLTDVTSRVFVPVSDEQEEAFRRLEHPPSTDSLTRLKEEEEERQRQREAMLTEQEKIAQEVESKQNEREQQLQKEKDRQVDVEQQHNERDSMLGEREKSIEEVESRQNERERSLNEREERLNEIEQDQKEKMDCLEQWERENSIERTTLEEKSKELDDRQQTLNDRDSRQNEREKQQTEREQQQIERDNTLQEKEEQLNKQEEDVTQREQTVTQEAAALKEREKQAEEEDKRLKDWDKKLIEQSQILNEKENVLEELQRKLSEQEETQKERQASLDKMEEALVEREAKADERENALNEHENALNEREKSLDKREKSLDEREKALDEREKALDERETALDEREKALDEREKSLDEHEKSLEEREKSLDEREKALDEREKELDEKEKTLIEQEVEQTKKQEELQQQEEAQNEREQQLNEFEERLKELDEQLKALQTRLEEEEELLKGRERILAELEEKQREWEIKAREEEDRLQMRARQMDEYEEQHKEWEIKSREEKEIIAERQKALQELEDMLKDWEKRSQEEEEKLKDEESKMRAAEELLLERERRVADEEEKQKDRRRKLEEEEERQREMEKRLEEEEEKQMEIERKLQDEEEKQRERERKLEEQEQQHREKEEELWKTCQTNSRFKIHKVDGSPPTVERGVGSDTILPGSKPRGRSLSPRARRRSASPGSSEGTSVASVLTEDDVFMVSSYKGDKKTIVETYDIKYMREEIFDEAKESVSTFGIPKSGKGLIKSHKSESFVLSAEETGRGSASSRSSSRSSRSRSPSHDAASRSASERSHAETQTSDSRRVSNEEKNRSLSRDSDRSQASMDTETTNVSLGSDLLQPSQQGLVKSVSFSDGPPVHIPATYNQSQEEDPSQESDRSHSRSPTLPSEIQRCHSPAITFSSEAQTAEVLLLPKTLGENTKSPTSFSLPKHQATMGNVMRTVFGEKQICNSDVGSPVCLTQKESGSADDNAVSDAAETVTITGPQTDAFTSPKLLDRCVLTPPKVYLLETVEENEEEKEEESSEEPDSRLSETVEVEDKPQPEKTSKALHDARGKGHKRDDGYSLERTDNISSSDELYSEASESSQDISIDCISPEIAKALPKLLLTTGTSDSSAAQPDKVTSEDSKNIFEETTQLYVETSKNKPDYTEKEVSGIRSTDLQPSLSPDDWSVISLSSMRELDTVLETPTSHVKHQSSSPILETHLLSHDVTREQFEELIPKSLDISLDLHKQSRIPNIPSPKESQLSPVLSPEMLVHSPLEKSSRTPSPLPYRMTPPDFQGSVAQEQDTICSSPEQIFLTEQQPHGKIEKAASIMVSKSEFSSPTIDVQPDVQPCELTSSNKSSPKVALDTKTSPPISPEVKPKEMTPLQKSQVASAPLSAELKSPSTLVSRSHSTSPAEPSCTSMGKSVLISKTPSRTSSQSVSKLHSKSLSRSSPRSPCHSHDKPQSPSAVSISGPLSPFLMEVAQKLRNSQPPSLGTLEAISPHTSPLSKASQYSAVQSSPTSRSRSLSASIKSASPAMILSTTPSESPEMLRSQSSSPGKKQSGQPALPSVEMKTLTSPDQKTSKQASIASSKSVSPSSPKIKPSMFLDSRSTPEAQSPKMKSTISSDQLLRSRTTSKSESPSFKMTSPSVQSQLSPKSTSPSSVKTRSPPTSSPPRSSRYLSKSNSPSPLKMTSPMTLDQRSSRSVSTTPPKIKSSQNPDQQLPLTLSSRSVSPPSPKTIATVYLQTPSRASSSPVSPPSLKDKSAVSSGQQSPSRKSVKSISPSSLKSTSPPSQSPHSPRLISPAVKSPASPGQQSPPRHLYSSASSSSPKIKSSEKFDHQSLSRSKSPPSAKVRSPLILDQQSPLVILPKSTFSSQKTSSGEKSPQSSLLSSPSPPYKTLKSPTLSDKQLPSDVFLQRQSKSPPTKLSSQSPPKPETMHSINSESRISYSSSKEYRSQSSTPVISKLLQSPPAVSPQLAIKTPKISSSNFSSPMITKFPYPSQVITKSSYPSSIISKSPSPTMMMMSSADSQTLSIKGEQIVMHSSPPSAKISQATKLSAPLRSKPPYTHSQSPANEDGIRQMSSQSPLTGISASSAEGSSTFLPADLDKTLPVAQPLHSKMQMLEQQESDPQIQPRSPDPLAHKRRVALRPKTAPQAVVHPPAAHASPKSVSGSSISTSPQNFATQHTSPVLGRRSVTRYSPIQDKSLAGMLAAQRRRAVSPRPSQQSSPTRRSEMTQSRSHSTDQSLSDVLATLPVPSSPSPVSMSPVSSPVLGRQPVTEVSPVTDAPTLNQEISRKPPASPNRALFSAAFQANGATGLKKMLTRQRNASKDRGQAKLASTRPNKSIQQRKESQTTPETTPAPNEAKSSSFPMEHTLTSVYQKRVDRDGQPPSSVVTITHKKVRYTREPVTNETASPNELPSPPMISSMPLPTNVTVHQPTAILPSKGVQGELTELSVHAEQHAQMSAPVSTFTQSTPETLTYHKPSHLREARQQFHQYNVDLPSEANKPLSESFADELSPSPRPRKMQMVNTKAQEAVPMPSKVRSGKMFSPKHNKSRQESLISHDSAVYRSPRSSEYQESPETLENSLIHQRQHVPVNNDYRMSGMHQEYPDQSSQSLSREKHFLVPGARFDLEQMKEREMILRRRLQTKKYEDKGAPKTKPPLKPWHSEESSFSDFFKEYQTECERRGTSTSQTVSNQSLQQSQNISPRPVKEVFSKSHRTPTLSSPPIKRRALDGYEETEFAHGSQQPGWDREFWPSDTCNSSPVRRPRSNERGRFSAYSLKSPRISPRAICDRNDIPMALSQQLQTHRHQQGVVGDSVEMAEVFRPSPVFETFPVQQEQHTTRDRSPRKQGRHVSWNDNQSNLNAAESSRNQNAASSPAENLTEKANKFVSDHNLSPADVLDGNGKTRRRFYIGDQSALSISLSHSQNKTTGVEKEAEKTSRSDFQMTRIHPTSKWKEFNEYKPYHQGCLTDKGVSHIVTDSSQFNRENSSTNEKSFPPSVRYSREKKQTTEYRPEGSNGTSFAREETTGRKEFTSKTRDNCTSIAHKQTLHRRYTMQTKQKRAVVTEERQHSKEYIFKKNPRTAKFPEQTSHPEGLAQGCEKQRSTLPEQLQNNDSRKLISSETQYGAKPKTRTTDVKSDIVQPQMPLQDRFSPVTGGNNLSLSEELRNAGFSPQHKRRSLNLYGQALIGDSVDMVDIGVVDPWTEGSVDPYCYPYSRSHICDLNESANSSALADYGLKQSPDMDVCEWDCAFFTPEMDEEDVGYANAEADIYLSQQQRDDDDLGFQSPRYDSEALVTTEESEDEPSNNFDKPENIFYFSATHNGAGTPGDSTEEFISFSSRPGLRGRRYVYKLNDDRNNSGDDHSKLTPSLKPSNQSEQEYITYENAIEASAIGGGDQFETAEGNGRDETLEPQQEILEHGSYPQMKPTNMRTKRNFTRTYVSKQLNRSEYCESDSQDSSDNCAHRNSCEDQEEDCVQAGRCEDGTPCTCDTSCGNRTRDERVYCLDCECDDVQEEYCPCWESTEHYHSLAGNEDQDMCCGGCDCLTDLTAALNIQEERHIPRAVTQLWYNSDSTEPCKTQDCVGSGHQCHGEDEPVDYETEEAAGQSPHQSIPSAYSDEYQCEEACSAGRGDGDVHPHTRKEEGDYNISRCQPERHKRRSHHRRRQSKLTDDAKEKRQLTAEKDEHENNEEFQKEWDTNNHEHHHQKKRSSAESSTSLIRLTPSAVKKKPRSPSTKEPHFTVTDSMVEAYGYNPLTESPFAARGYPELPMDTSTLDHISVPFVKRKAIVFLRSDKEDFVEVGRGTYGCVYLAQATTRRGTAKVVVKDFFTDSTSWDLIVHEARMLCYLQDTGVIPHFYGLLKRRSLGDDFSLIQQYFAQGKTLHTALVNKEKLDPDVWQDVAWQLARGLLLIHERHVLLNDLKGDNVLIDLRRERKIVKYIDLGMATYRKGLNFHLPEDQMAKFNFLSPEVRAGAYTSPMSDVYSLGYLLDQINRLAQLQVLQEISTRCMDELPADRPHLADVVDMLLPDLE